MPMPVIRFDRLPLPNLKTYTFFSVIALSACVYIASDMIDDDQWTLKKSSQVSHEIEHLMVNGNGTNNNRTMRQWVYDISSVMIKEPFCVWVLINMAVCGLILLGRCIQKIVFGDLRVSEQQQLKDNFWNFIFAKFIFIFGVINVQYVEEVLLWCSWFALLGFLQLIAQLTKDRFEYWSFSSTTPIWSHVKLMGLLVCVLAISGIMLIVTFFIGFFIGFNVFAFMVPEVLLLTIRTMHVILRYGFHLYEVRHEGNIAQSGGGTSEGGKIWEKRGPITYYLELGFELTALFIDFLHHIHMLLWSNIFLSMASLVICMQLRYLFREIQRHLKKHRNYLWVRNHLEQNYPMATTEELSINSDNCAICWEKMDSARKLPCSHLFHNTCLQSWLEQDTSCPTCRHALSIQNHGPASRIDPNDHNNDNPQPERREVNHFFHFDGSRYVSWLPSLFVEVRQAHVRVTDAQNSQLDAMARQVQQLFPHMSLAGIMDDLRITRSVELTADNVLEGRLVQSPIFRDPEPSSSSIMSPTISSSSLSAPLPTVSSANWKEMVVEPVETESVSGRFSKSPEERERILCKRKEHMRHAARKRYLEKKSTESTTISSSSSSNLHQS